MKIKSQGRILIQRLKARPLTYREMQDMHVSTSPHKRVMECLREDEQILRVKGADGLIRWRVVPLRKGQS